MTRVVAVLAWLVPMAAPAGAAPADAPPVLLTLQEDTHRGIEKCLVMSVGATRLVAVPAWAGRLSVLDFGGGNVLYTDPQVDGRVLKPDETWAPWDGSATDVVTMEGGERRSQWRGLWLHPWKAAQQVGKGPLIIVAEGSAAFLNIRRSYRGVRGNALLPDRLSVASDPSPDVPLSAKRSYALSADGQRLVYEFTVTCHGGEPRGWTVCERVLVPAGGYALLPLEKGGAYPGGWAARDGAAAPGPEHASTAGDFLVLRAGAAKGVGVAARVRAGWMAHVRGGHALLMIYPIAKDGPYPVCAGANALAWIAAPYLELEPLSAEAILAAGRSLTFRQEWRWLALPPDVSESIPEAVGRWLEERAAEGARPAAP